MWKTNKCELRHKEEEGQSVCVFVCVSPCTTEEGMCLRVQVVPLTSCEGVCAHSSAWMCAGSPLLPKG